MTLVGRAGALDKIATALRDGRSVRVAGGRGTGRSAVLAEAAARHAADGVTVLAVRALPGDESLPGAGLQRLLTPVQEEANALPATAAAAFAQLFGADPPDVAPLPLPEAVALLAEHLAAHGRWLWCADDLDRLDALTQIALATQAHIPVLTTSLPHPNTNPAEERPHTPTPATSPPRPTTNPAAQPPPPNTNPAEERPHTPALAASFPRPHIDLAAKGQIKAEEVHIGRLSRVDAELVLGAMPGVRAHPGARLLLAQASGNPLALTELANHLPPPTELTATTTELPVPPRLRRALAPAVDTLDQPHLHAALLAALATETPGAHTSAVLGAAVAPEIWADLVVLGLLRPGVARRFHHPVARAAVLDRAGSAARQKARHELAALLKPGHPTLGEAPGRTVDNRSNSDSSTTRNATQGEAAGGSAAGGGAAGAGGGAAGGGAAGAGGGAAGGGPADADGGAAGAGGGAAGAGGGAAGAGGGAGAGGVFREAAWAWHLGRADPSPAECLAGPLERAAIVLTRGGRIRAAAYALALAAARTGDPERARARRHRAAHHARLAGEPAWEAQLGTSLENLGQRLRTAWLRGDDTIRVERAPTELMAAWAQAVLHDTDPGGNVQRLINEYPRTTDPLAPDERSIVLGTIAMARHETTLAVRHLTRAAALAPPGGLIRPIALGALAWTHFDGGALDDAREQAELTLAAGDADRHGVATADTRAGALATLAAVAVLREDPDAADRLGAARDALQPGHHALHDLRLDRAQGLIAGIRGEHALAFHRLRRHFDEHGRPVHHRISDLCLGDLALVGTALGRTRAIEDLVEAAGSRVRTLRSARLSAIWHRARALLAGPDPAAETFFRLALADPSTDQWAFERALTRMDYAIWLRRRQRPAESRQLLSAARDVFAAADLPAWRERAEAELLAAAAPATVRDDVLTPQQRQVVTLAAQGLTNARIAARLGLSARTVGTHLSRAYPILGVTRRTQLSAVQSFDGRREDQDRRT